jgi:hypothetical protein
MRQMEQTYFPDPAIDRVMGVVLEPVMGRAASRNDVEANRGA